MNNDYYKSPKPSWLMRQFWKACGADAYLLSKCTYSDQIKYFCLGGIVIATGVMAALAGGYAFYTIFEPKGSALEGMLTSDALKAGATSKDLIHFPTVILASLFGILWGLIIYNIDRFIVTSTGKGDGTEAITKQEIKSALPRIIMGMIIALTISKPVEIRMFKSEIDSELAKLQDAKYLERKGNIDKMFEEKIHQEKERINKLETEIKNAYEDAQNAEIKFNEEMDGQAGARGYGKEAEKKETAMKRYWDAYNKLKASNDGLISKSYTNIEKLEVEKDELYSKAWREVQALDGLLERIKLAHEIAGWAVSLFITLLFMVIELTPIFFKMMLIKSPYDYLDENIKELARAEEGIEVVYNYYKDGEGNEVHKVINHFAELKAKERILMIKAQEELNKTLIDKWKEQKMKEIEKDPSKYYHEEK